MACRSVFRMFIPKETKEAMAMENARLLMQAQSDLNLLAGQMAASEEGTRRQIEWYKQQQERQGHQNPPQHNPHQNRQVYQIHPNGEPVYLVMRDQRDDRGDCIIS